MMELIEKFQSIKKSKIEKNDCFIDHLDVIVIFIAIWIWAS